MGDGLTDSEIRAWRSFLSANVRLLHRLDHELQRRSHLSLTDHDILLELSRAPSQRIRMSELADLVVVSRSRLTYRINRLAELGYVTREECRDDRRGMFAILTPTGAAVLAEATPGHLADIRTWFFGAMSLDEREVVGRVMARMDTNLTIS